MKFFKLFILATTSYIALNLVTPTACFDTETAHDTKSYIVAETQSNDSSEYPYMPADANSPGGEIV